MTQPPETRISLIGRLHDPTDSAAWSEFVEIYQPMIQRIVQRRGLQYADAAEVTQDVLARVSRAVVGWDPDPDKGSFRGWLYRMTRNLTVDHIRRNKSPNMKRDSDSHFDLNQIAEPTADESQEFQVEYERQLFNWAAANVQSSFKPENWQAFWMTTVEGKSIDETAQKLELQRGAIYVARSRVMAKIALVIRERLQQSNEANEK
ncbi:MAG: RNA polymerase sigma factor [Mariniblastus sp.]